MSLQRRDRIDAPAGALDRPCTTHREDLVTVLLATWLIGGIGLVQTRRADHLTWTQAVPLGCGLGLVGVTVFAVGGVGDLLGHPVFGIEQGIAPLLSPTHLLLFSGVALLLLAPFRAAWSSPEAVGGSARPCSRVRFDHAAH
jgi:hypothetical protein